ncbi:ribonuclease H2, subunit C [Pyronema omphalodes]|nr:ribonuclease H2, subunit C [Pyronema omphalodes]
MHAIAPIATSTKPASVNLLPCNILHNGPVAATKKHWDPKMEEGKCTAYFRGRKLEGRNIQLPEGVVGAILETTTDAISPENENEDEDDEEEAVAKEIKTLATFDKITVWGHGQVPESGDGGVVRSIEEWITFAGKIHQWDDDE